MTPELIEATKKLTVGEVAKLLGEWMDFNYEAWEYAVWSAIIRDGFPLFKIPVIPHRLEPNSTMPLDLSS